MGKRAHVPPSDLQNYITPPIRRTIRKRKVCNGNVGVTTPLRPSKSLRLNSDIDVDEDDEDSSSNDTQVQYCSTKHANNSSILLNSSLKNTAAGLEQASPATNESPRPVYTLRPSVVNGTILYDLAQKPWRLGNPIGKGNFGEIFLASDKISIPVTNENAKFVVKIEPHSNGPLFVEIHCLMNTAKKRDRSTTSTNIKTEDDEFLKNPLNTAPSGIPDYIASGSHYFGDARYRFLVLQRFDNDLYSLIKNSCVSQKSMLTLAIQIVNVLENLHDKGYCHNDVKSQNLMISKCKYFKNKIEQKETNRTVSKYIDNYEEKQPTTDSGNSSEQEANDDDFDRDFVMKRKTTNYSEEIEDDEDFDDGTTTSNSNSNSMDMYKTPVMKNRNRRRAANRAAVQYSGSNPVRSCRRPERRNSTYDEMVNSHYLRPSKRISYSEFFVEDGIKPEADGDLNSRDTNFNSTEDDDSIGFVPNSLRRRFGGTANTSLSKKSNGTSRTNKIAKNSSTKRLTRRQEKLEKLNHFAEATQQPTAALVPVEAEHIFLIDFGLASKYIDNGVHRPFVMDQRRAHDGTLEFTSRDAHMGAHSRRSDLECLGYNLLFWSQGFLPWKDAATQQQQEKVHRAKEYLMTDVREMLKQIYGKDVPKYLGEFLHQVGQLAYHERPQYARYRRLFEREYQQLGLSVASMCLDSQDIARTCIKIKKDHGAGKHDIFELNHKLSNSSILSIMKSGGTPFQERGSLADRVSPKNLRSKSDKKAARKKKFCWAEVLSQDPDQIARERAEKEFDREINYEETRPVRRYEGKPTYAILELLKKNNEESNQEEEKEEEEEEEEEEEGNADNEGQEEEDDSEEAEASEVDAGDDDEEEEHEEEEEEDLNCTEWQEEEEEEGEVEEDEEEGEEEEEAEEEEEEIVSSEAEDSVENTDEEDEDVASENDEHFNNKKFENDSAEEEKEEASSSSEQYKTHLRNKKRTKNEMTSLKSVNRKSKNIKRATKSTQKKSPSKNTTRARSLAKKLLKENQNTSGMRKNLRKMSRGKSNAAAAASAAGEDEQQTLSHFLYEHRQNSQQQCKSRNGVEKDAPDRRKRRCLLKTDSTELMNGNGNGRILGVDVTEDSNSNFGPDVRILFNVWKKMSNENIYAKSAASVPSRTLTATTAGGGMVTRHYRK